MRIMAVIVLGICLPMAGLSQDQQPGPPDQPRTAVNVEDQGAGIIGPRANITHENIRQPNGRSYACPTVQALDREVRALREHIAWMRQRYAEEHPDVQRARVRLAEAQVALAAERAKAASQALDCSATDATPERTEPAAAEPAR